MTTTFNDINLSLTARADGSSTPSDPDGEGGGGPEPGELTLLFAEDFSTGTLAEKTWIWYQSGNLNYAAIADRDGVKVIRQNIFTDRGSNDPITGKLPSGLAGHMFLASNFHNSEDNPEITFEMTLRFDDCHWKSTDAPDYPQIAGKMFIQDTIAHHAAGYLSLTNGNQLRITSGNNGVSGDTWSLVDAGGWVNRDYGWRTTGGAPRGGFYFATPTPIFRSDGVFRTLVFEVKYNPGNIGYHKCRFKIAGEPLHDASGVNTDANGWFNYPIEFEFEGMRVICAAGPDFNDPDDIDTMPGTYTGYIAGYEATDYTISAGIAE
jgi:hypothetical protein